MPHKDATAERAAPAQVTGRPNQSERRVLQTPRSVDTNFITHQGFWTLGSLIEHAIVFVVSASVAAVVMVVLR